MSKTKEKNAPARDKHIIIVERSVKVELTDAELLDRGQKLAQSIQEQRNAEADLASFKSGIKSRLDACAAEQSRYQTAIKEGAEWRMLDCAEEHNYKDKTIKIRRMFDGKVVESRPMSESELQMNLPGTDEPNVVDLFGPKLTRLKHDEEAEEAEAEAEAEAEEEDEEEEEAEECTE